jgi:hypothetical protein
VGCGVIGGISSAGQERVVAREIFRKLPARKISEIFFIIHAFFLYEKNRTGQFRIGSLFARENNEQTC